MKKVWLLVALMVALVAMSASAQSPIKFGIKAGLGMANVSGDGWDVASADLTDIDNKYKVGFGFGVMAQIPLGESGLMLQPEAMYVMKGSKLEFVGEEAAEYDIEAKMKIDYIEIPVLIKYSFPTSGKIAPALFAGPAVAFNVSSKFETEGADAEALADEIPSGDIYNQKSIDFGIVFGGGIDFNLGERNKLVLDVRYTLGLMNAYDDVAEDEEIPDGEVEMTGLEGAGLELKNSNIQFTVGFLF